MNPTITKLAFQALTGRRRFWLLLLFPLGLVGFTILIRVLTGSQAAAWQTLFSLGLSLVLPLLALISATSVMGPEVDDGSIVYLLAKPVSRHSIAQSKYAVALGAVLVVGTAPLLVVGIIVRPSAVALTLAMWIGSVVSAIAYTAIFLALSAVWRHAVVVGLLFILIWEGTLGNLFSGIAWLSVAQWGERVAIWIDADSGSSDVALWWAVLALVVASVAGVWWTGDRLRSFAFKGDE